MSVKQSLDATGGPQNCILTPHFCIRPKGLGRNSFVFK